MARIESYSRACFILKKMLKVLSKTAPFMAEAASSAGATKAAYSTWRPPSRVTVPTSAPMPTPIANR